MVEELGLGRGVGKEEPDEDGPQASGTTKLKPTVSERTTDVALCHSTHNEEDQLPALGSHGGWKL